MGRQPLGLPSCCIWSPTLRCGFKRRSLKAERPPFLQHLFDLAIAPPLPTPSKRQSQGRKHSAPEPSHHRKKVCARRLLSLPVVATQPLGNWDTCDSNSSAELPPFAYTMCVATPSLRLKPLQQSISALNQKPPQGCENKGGRSALPVAAAQPLGNWDACDSNSSAELPPLPVPCVWQLRLKPLQQSISTLNQKPPQRCNDKGGRSAAQLLQSSLLCQAEKMKQLEG